MQSQGIKRELGRRETLIRVKEKPQQFFMTYGRTLEADNKYLDVIEYSRIAESERHLRSKLGMSESIMSYEARNVVDVRAKVNDTSIRRPITANNTGLTRDNEEGDSA